MGNKLFLSMLAAVLFAGTISASTDKKIVIETASGVSESSLSELRCMKFDNGSMMLALLDGTIVGWNTDEVVKITIAECTGGVETSLNGICNAPQLCRTGNAIIVRSPSCQVLLLYSDAGEVLYRTSFCGEEIIDMSSFPEGLYILNVNDQAYKIINR